MCTWAVWGVTVPLVSPHIWAFVSNLRLRFLEEVPSVLPQAESFMSYVCMQGEDRLEGL